MSDRNLTIRLFVSSTFSDFKAERDVLQRDIFPKLSQLCLSKGFRFQAIDLRWGVPEEAGQDNRTMRICRRELNRCQEPGRLRPNFLILFGGRYGWLPLPDAIPKKLFDVLEKYVGRLDLLQEWYLLDSNAVPPIYELQPRKGRFIDSKVWRVEVERPLLAALEEALRDAPRLSPAQRAALAVTPIGLSATHQEIHHGALSLPTEEVRAHVHAFERKIYDAPEPSHSSFADFQPDGSPDTKCRQKLRALRNKLHRHLGKTNVHPYEVPWRENGAFSDADLAVFSEKVYTQLKRVIETQIAVLLECAPEDHEDNAHDAFGEDRRSGFFGREEPLRHIADYLRAGPAQPLAVTGPAGSGKSALMAEAVHCARQAADSQAVILARFIGATPGSANEIELLRDLVGRSSQPQDETDSPRDNGEAAQENRAPDDREVPSNLNRLTNAFHEALSRAKPERPLWLFLDAVDQLRDTTLAWIPATLPPGVRLVVSTALPSASDDSRATTLKQLERLAPGPQTVRLEPLGRKDGEALLRGWLKAAGRTLQAGQEKAILDTFVVEGNALWLRVAAGEAARWPCWHTPEPFASGLPELLQTVLECLSRPEEHGRILVQRALGYLACARHGLVEDELIGVLGADRTLMEEVIARSPTERRKPKADRIKSLPLAVWARFYGDISAYLSERQSQGASLLGFYHRSFGEAVERFCVGSDADRLPLHETMARWFGAQEWFLPPISDTGEPRKPNRDDPANARKGSELPWHLHRAAELSNSDAHWNTLVEVLCDLDCIEVKARAGLVYELVSDYNAALAALPEFRKEQELLRRHDRAMLAYNRALREYAVVRCDWWFAKERGESPTEPSYPPLPPALQGEESHEIPEQTSCLATRLRHFANFVSGHLPPLAQFPNDTVPLAYNWADSGPVAVQAEVRVQDLKMPWLKRSPRPPVQPLRPQCQRVLEGHEAEVRSVGVSPDGRCAVSASRDGTLRLWNLASGACVRILEGHRSKVNCLCVCSDGRRIVSGSNDGILRIWDLESAACLRTLRGHSDRIKSVGVSPDGRCAVSASRDATLRVWDLESGTCIRTLEGHGDGVNSVSVSSDGRRAVSGGDDKTLRVWNLVNGACIHALEGHGDGVSSVSVSPDGRRAVSASWDATLRVWDLERGACLYTLEGHSGGVSSVSVSPDGRRAVSAGWADKTLRVWDVNARVCLRTLKGHCYPVLSVSVSPDGRRAVSASKDATLRVWDLESGARQCTLEGHSGGVSSVSVSPDGRRAVSAGLADKTLRVWDANAGVCRRTLEDHCEPILSVSVSPDGRRAVSAGGDKDNSLRVWDLESGTCLYTLEGHTVGVTSVSVSLDGRCAVSAGQDKTLRVWDLESGSCLRTLRGYHRIILDVRVILNNHHVVLTGRGKRLGVLDMASDACVRSLESHRGSPAGDWCVSVSMDSRFVVVGSLNEAMIRVWDLASGACLRTFEGHRNGVCSVSVNSDGWHMVSAGYDNTLKVWSLQNEECLAVYHSGSTVLTIVCLLGSNRIVCGTQDGQMHFLTAVNLPSPGPPIITPVRVWLFGELKQQPDGTTIAAPGRWSDHLICRCPHCYRPFVTPDPVADCGLRNRKLMRKNIWPHDAAYDDPRLLAPCPHCGKPLKFNPFFVTPESAGSPAKKSKADHSSRA